MKIGKNVAGAEGDAGVGSVRTDDRTGKRRVLAVASGGGHWEQLMQLRPALEQFEIHYATTDPSLGEREGIAVHIVSDGNRASGLGIFRCLREAWRLIRAIRPDVVVTTGAMPGLFCLIAGRAAGARAIWIDSIANCDRPSLSARLAWGVANLRLTQWEHLARPNGPYFVGSVL